MNTTIINALQTERRAHLANIQLLEATLPDLEADNADRAHRTIAHLRSRVELINAKLQRPCTRAAA